MNKIASFEDFKKSKISPSIKEDREEKENNEGHEHYMFFQNLASIKHYIEEILKMEPEQIDNMLKNGHDWAADHIATSKDDIQEVAEWIRNEMENPGHSEGGEEDDHSEPDVDNIIVNIEDGNDDEEEGEDDEDDDEDEEEEEEA